MLTALLVKNVKGMFTESKEAHTLYRIVQTEVHKRDEETEVDWPDEKHAQSCS